LLVCDPIWGRRRRRKKKKKKRRKKKNKKIQSTSKMSDDDKSQGKGDHTDPFNRKNIYWRSLSIDIYRQHTNKGRNKK
jgi:hypothetical protein